MIVSEAASQGASDVATVGSILDSIASLVIVTDLGGNILHFNKACEELTGYHTAEMQGQNLVTKLIPEDELDGVRQAAARLRNGEPSVPHTYHWLSKDGKKCLIHWTNRIWRSEAGDQFFIATGAEVDASHQHLARELHDGIRQHLLGMRMLATQLHSALAKRAAPEATLAEAFKESVAEANALVRNVIQGLTPSTVKAQHFRSAVERIAQNFERWYSVSVPLTYDPAPALTDDGTPHHLYYIIQEALTNAAKHSKTDVIHVFLTQTPEGVELRIEDEGIGFPEGYEHSGGMGITNMQERAALIGAHLTLTNKPEGGAVLTCTLGKVQS